MQLFLDLDGVLADFDTGYEQHFGVSPCKIKDNVDWRSVAKVANFYRDLPPMPDTHTLWAAVKHLRPMILTGIPSSVKEAADNKRAWVFKNLGPHIPVICCASKDKSFNCEPGDILIDDWIRYQQLWVTKGGIWITHTSAQSSINRLKELSVID